MVAAWQLSYAVRVWLSGEMRCSYKCGVNIVFRFRVFSAVRTVVGMNENRDEGNQGF